MILRAAKIILLTFLAAGAAWGQSQSFPRAGTHFTFGIPEGPDALSDTAIGTGLSEFLLDIVSTHDGKGIITSPSGYCQEFSFFTDSVTTIVLPYNLMHLKEIGKTNKGILIRTSQPVNLTFHDVLFDAGESTQIYPDEALDTGYHITTWGIYDDPSEDNHSQFIITASQDNTDVTIIPSVNTVSGHRAGIPITTNLNRGECYIVKADATDLPVDLSLTHSEVHASKPVSILSAVSCGYVPLRTEACQELLDELLPRHITDAVFYVTPLRDQNVQNTVLFTSETKNFFVFATNGTTYNTNNGWLTLTIDSIPQVFTLSAQAQCFIFSEGSEIQNGVGDPTMTTVLPVSQWADTMIFYTPDFFASDGLPFSHFLALTYPQAAEANIMLDGSPIKSISIPQQIISSTMSGTTVVIGPGMHIVTSPVPIAAIAAGFNPQDIFGASADAYSFIPGRIAPKLPADTLPVFVSIDAEQAMTCRTFKVNISSAFHSLQDVTSGILTITYDPKILTLLGVNLGPAAQGGQWTTDTRIPGTITIDASCLAPYNDSAIFATLFFSTGPPVVTTTISADFEQMGGEIVYGALAGKAKKDISILEARDTSNAVFAIDAGTAVFGNIDRGTVRLVTPPNDSVKEIDLFITYNHDLLTLQLADLKNTALSVSGAVSPIAPIPFDKTTDEIIITFPTPVLLSAPGVIAGLVFQTYVTDSTSDMISLRTSMHSSRLCPLDILSGSVSSEFIGTDTCGTHTLRSEIRNEPIDVTSIIPNPSTGSFTVNLSRHVFAGDPVHLELFDMLGNKVWNMDYLSTSINQQISCIVPKSVSEGSYFLRASVQGKTETRRIIITK